MDDVVKSKLKNLVAQVQAGNDESFGEIYQHYLNPIFRFIVGLGVDQDTAADLTQDVFIKAWSKIDQYADQGHSFGSWLYVIARTTTLDWLKKKKPFLIDDELGFWEAFPSSEPSAEILAEQRLNKDLLESALTKIGHNDREVLVLYYMSELSHEAIAKILDLSVEAVRQRKSRALKALRDQVLFFINKYE